MKQKKIIYKNSIKINNNNFSQKKKINKKYSKIINKIIFDLDNIKDTFHCLSNKFKLNFTANDLKNFRNFNTIVIVGMGGSILGSKAIYYFLEKKIKKKFIFLDNINEINLDVIKSKKKDLSKTLFLIISKSGDTVETLSNLLALKIIKRKSKNIIIISEKNNNSLYLLSKKFQLYHIKHKKYIGGRYSVLTEVGMVPAYLMGLNILKFRENLQVHFKNNNKIFLKESVIKIAHLLKNNKIKNLIFFNYIPQLGGFLYWAQQLIAESLGKKGKGFLPIISAAPKDHHSLLQLYLDGPRDKLFYIFSLDQDNKKKINSKVFGKKLEFLNNKSLDRIKKAQKEAFIEILKKKNIPFREFKIFDLSEKILGELFSYFMLETSIIGKLTNIDPFNQPAVEQVKISTKKNLS